MFCVLCLFPHFVNKTTPGIKSLKQENEQINGENYPHCQTAISFFFCCNTLIYAFAGAQFRKDGVMGKACVFTLFFGRSQVRLPYRLVFLFYFSLACIHQTRQGLPVALIYSHTPVWSFTHSETNQTYTLRHGNETLNFQQTNDEKKTNRKRPCEQPKDQESHNPQRVNSASSSRSKGGRATIKDKELTQRKT